MKKFFILASAIVLIGCATAPVTPETKEETKTESVKPTISSEKISSAQLGEVCGGQAGTPCDVGLECQFDPAERDARGKCIDAIVDKTLKCDPVKAPVCAVKNGNKNGYLNECEARRHGAEILHEKFCKLDPNVVGNCSASAMGMGNCFDVVRGFEFKDGECRERKVAGCEAEIPFQTKEECEKKCK